jgi:hypothetical protein
MFDSDKHFPVNLHLLNCTLNGIILVLNGVMVICRGRFSRVKLGRGHVCRAY